VRWEEEGTPWPLIGAARISSIYSVFFVSSDKLKLRLEDSHVTSVGLSEDVETHSFFNQNLNQLNVIELIFFIQLIHYIFFKFI
jgi:hypothetical protein